MKDNAKQVFQKVTQNINLHTGTVESKRTELLQYFDATWKMYEALFETLASSEAFYLRPQALRHPIIFYFGHTAVFFVNKLILAKLLPKRVNSDFESKFAIGVDEMSWDDLNEDNYNWPSVGDVRAYRNDVYQAVVGIIDSIEFSLPIEWESPMWTIIMGIEHERIHLETSSVLIRQLPISQVKQSPLFRSCGDWDTAPENELIPVCGNQIQLGKPKTHHLYGWDNEYGSDEVYVEDFDASKYLVSNGEYLAFVNDGGYQSDEYWDEEGISWKAFHRADKPEFWVHSGSGEYKLRLMTEEIALPLNWPAEVCYLEAKAFCHWKSRQLQRTIRLPDEGEYRRLLEVAKVDREHCESPIQANWNLEKYGSSCPVDRFAHGEFCDLVGNVWQWNETPIYGFDGFNVHPIYDDFSTPTFDNRHSLIKGGSWVSTGNEIALHSRYAFRRHFYQHAGFRYVASEKQVKTTFDVYETDSLISMYLEFHYGNSYYNVPNFSKAIAQIAMDATQGKPTNKALDIGCAVGRCTFELSRKFDVIDGLDFSARFIKQAVAILESGTTKYELPIEGDLVEFKECNLEALGIDVSTKKISFLQQDACNMKSIFTGYDLVVAANLIDRLNDPAKFLVDIQHRINAGGVLVIASPYTWLEEFTHKEKWLGGFKKDGEPVSTLQGLHALLDERFVLSGQPKDVPFVIRETARKFQHTLSQVTVWQKK